MKISWVAALFALLVMAAAPLPAAASTGDHVRKTDMRERGQERSGAWRKGERRRMARAAIGYDDFDAGPRRRYHANQEGRPRFTKRRTARHSVRAHRPHQVARRSLRRTAHRSVRRAHRSDARTHVSSGSATNGMASYYYQGSVVASGARFNPDGLTAAHRSLPFGTRVRVTHLGNGRSVNVTINDRGPFVGGRIIDLSRGAAGVIGMIGQGLAHVSVMVLGR